MRTQPLVTLVTDDALLLDRLTASLDSAADVVTAGTLADGHELLIDAAASLLVLARQVDGTDSLELVRALRARSMGLPIMMITDHDSVSDRIRCLDAGVSDNLLNPFDPGELRARVRALTRVYTSDNGPVVIGEWQFSEQSGSMYSPYVGRVMLSPRETSLLALLAAHPAEAVGRERILGEVFQNAGTPGTVDTYVHHIRAKTERSVITTVRGRGYRIGAP